MKALKLIADAQRRRAEELSYFMVRNLFFSLERRVYALQLNLDMTSVAFSSFFSLFDPSFSLFIYLSLSFSLFLCVHYILRTGSNVHNTPVKPITLPVTQFRGQSVSRQGITTGVVAN